MAKSRENPVRRVVDVLGGRVAPVASMLKVSRQTVYNWLEDGRVESARDAVLLHRAAKAKGHVVSIETLAGL